MSDIDFENTKERKYSDYMITFLLGPRSTKIEILSEVWDENFDWQLFMFLLRKNVVLRRVASEVNELREIDSSCLKQSLDVEGERVLQGLKLIDLLDRIFEERNISYVVIKSLDNYPDQGHDIDILVREQFKTIERIVIGELGGVAKNRTLSDKLAGKKSYRIPGFPTLEVHYGRLGQIGEHKRLAEDLLRYRRRVEIDSISAYVPPNGYQLYLVVLQRIYRHFNLRLCDMFNTAQLIRSDLMDWDKIFLNSAEYGIQGGVSSYLQLIHNFYYDQFNERLLPSEVIEKFRLWNGKVKLRFIRGYYRFPIWSIGSKAYWEKYRTDLSALNIEAITRLGLLLPLMLITYANLRFFPKWVLWKRIW